MAKDDRALVLGLHAVPHNAMWSDDDTLVTADDAALRTTIEWRHRLIDSDLQAIANLRYAMGIHQRAIRIMTRELGLRAIVRRRDQWMGGKLGMCVELLHDYMAAMRLLPATATRVHAHVAHIERTYDGVPRTLTIRRDGQVVGHDLNLVTSDVRTWYVLFLN